MENISQVNHVHYLKKHCLNLEIEGDVTDQAFGMTLAKILRSELCFNTQCKVAKKIAKALWLKF